MKILLEALWVEALKIRRSKLLWITIIVVSFFAFVLGFLMFVLKNPEIAREYGLIAAKASIAGNADWPSLFRMLTMMTGAAGMIGFGFLASWIFGREYVERTFKDLLAVPVSRYSIITAKFLVLGTWCILLAVLFLLLGFLAGMVVGLAGWSGQTIEQGIITYALTSSLTLLLVTVVAFFASLGRGYLPPLAFMILTLLLANVITLLGYGPYFPWAIPILASGAGGKDAAQVETASYIILFLTSIAGLAGTFAWWRFADQA